MKLTWNLGSTDWALFEKELQGELQDTYRVLANTATTSAATEQARGKAAFISKLLNLKKAPTQITGPGETEY